VETVYITVDPIGESAPTSAPEPVPTSSVYTLDEAAEVLGIGRHALLAAIRRSEIPALKVGRYRYVSRIWLDRALAAGTL